MSLAKLIERCKEEHAGLMFCETVRVEKSKKYYRNGNEDNERYSVPVLYREFQRYRLGWQRRLLSAVNFSSKDFKAMLADIGCELPPESDIIFGIDGEKGKLYIDNGRADVPWRLVCYERTKKGGKPDKVKYYCNVAGQPDLLEVRLDSPRSGNVVAYHKRMASGWVAVAADSVTYYYREGELWASLCDIWKFLSAK